jgi:hypothetical protein
VDDTLRPMLVDDADYGQWVSPQPNQDIQDWYFFGHGLNFKQGKTID